jgi:hypothetical protein
LTLPPRSSNWYTALQPSKTPIRSDLCTEAITVDLPIDISTLSPSPVSKANRDSWTEKEREKASNGFSAIDEQGLRNLVSGNNSTKNGMN